MYYIRSLLITMLLTVMLFGCAADSHIYEKTESKTKTSSTVSTPSLYKREDNNIIKNGEQEHMKYLLESVLESDIFSNIKTDTWYNESHCISFRKPPLYLEFKSNMLVYQDVRTIDWKRYNKDFFWGLSSENTIISCDIFTGKLYDAEYWARDYYNVTFLNNNISAILCYWQGHKHWRESARTSYDGYRVLLFDHFADLLPYQLRFDYGKRIEFIYDEYQTFYFDEYMIIGLTYNTKKEQYVAVYGINAHLFMENTMEWTFANNRREIGVAIFDCYGNQLERYNLPYIVYPQFTDGKISLAPNGSSQNPDLFMIEDDKLLIIPKEGDEMSDVMMKYNGISTTAPVLLDLKTRKTTLWTHEEMASFLVRSEKYEGELERAWGGGEVWNVREELPPMPYEMLWEETDTGEPVTLVRMLGEEQALFALPGKVSTQIWTQTDDGTIHAIVSVAPKED